jgi:NADPH-dependent 2,4-dienoyl-CoA reductase/sulfur reductase-like enzyme
MISRDRLTRRTFLSASAASTTAAWLGTFTGRPARAEDLEPTTHVSLEKQIVAIRDANAGKTGRHVTILGAGMVGLAAAFELRKLGHRVTLLEGSHRVGGRVWTQRFPSEGSHPEQYHELGAMRIPASHDYTRHYVRTMG